MYLPYDDNDLALVDGQEIGWRAYTLGARFGETDWLGSQTRTFTLTGKYGQEWEASNMLAECFCLGNSTDERMRAERQERAIEHIRSARENGHIHNKCGIYVLRTWEEIERQWLAYQLGSDLPCGAASYASQRPVQVLARVVAAGELAKGARGFRAQQVTIVKLFLAKPIMYCLCRPHIHISDTGLVCWTCEHARSESPAEPRTVQGLLESQFGCNVKVGWPTAKERTV